MVALIVLILLLLLLGGGGLLSSGLQILWILLVIGLITFVRYLFGASMDSPADAELLQLPNFIGTPHIGGSTHDAVLAMGRAAIAGLDGTSGSIDATSNH